MSFQFLPPGEECEGWKIHETGSAIHIPQEFRFKNPISVETVQQLEKALQGVKYISLGKQLNSYAYDEVRTREHYRVSVNCPTPQQFISTMMKLHLILQSSGLSDKIVFD